MRRFPTASAWPERAASTRCARTSRRFEALGARYVLLDTYADDPEATRDPEVAWRMLRTLAERVLDLPREALR